MRYEHIKEGIFLSRPNRFIAHVKIDGREEIVHVKNTGRCKELLVPGCRVWLEHSDAPKRKTAYDLVTVEKAACGNQPTRLVNMDSQAPNRLFYEWAREGNFIPGLTTLRPETVWGNSRFDFYWEKQEGEHRRKGFVELKGCTLEREGWAYFPDAPTERGVKHLEELTLAVEAGYEAAVCFLIQMSDVLGFSPNDETHPAFGETLRRASAHGVRVLAYACRVVPGEVCVTHPVKVVL